MQVSTVTKLALQAGLGAFALGLAGCSPPATYEDSPSPSVAEEALSEAEPMEPDEEVVTSDHDHHDDHDDHDDDEDFHGEAHVHGAATLAVTLDGGFVTAALEAPLANFGVSEASKANDETYEPYAEDIGELLGNGVCEEAERAANVHRAGDHAHLELSIVWECKRPSGLDGFKVGLFDAFSGFETVDAVFIGEDSQSAVSLSPDDTVLIFE